jgi:hypothetical protein
VSKAELASVVERMSALGLGSHITGVLTGFSSRRIQEIRTECTLVRNRPRASTDFILAHLPPDLRADINKIKTRSDAARMRASIKEGITDATLREHRIVDDGEDETLNDVAGGIVAPCDSVKAA